MVRWRGVERGGEGWSGQRLERWRGEVGGWRGSEVEVEGK